MENLWKTILNNHRWRPSIRCTGCFSLALSPASPTHVKSSPAFFWMLSERKHNPVYNDHHNRCSIRKPCLQEYTVTTNLKHTTCSKTHVFFSLTRCYRWYTTVLMAVYDDVISSHRGNDILTSDPRQSQQAQAWRAKANRLTNERAGPLVWSSFSRNKVFIVWFSIILSERYLSGCAWNLIKISEHFETDQTHLFHILLNSWDVDRENIPILGKCCQNLFFFFSVFKVGIFYDDFLSFCFHFCTSVRLRAQGTKRYGFFSF